MQFTYKAIDDEGRLVSGRLEADNVSDLELRLQRMDLDLVSYREKKTSSLSFSGGGARVQRQELITFCFYMEQLLRAGVPLLQGLTDLRDSMGHLAFRNILTSLIEDIQSGRHLSEAMARYPKVFDAVFTNLINVGEESGELDKVFHHLSDSLKWQDELMAQMKKVLTYPLLLATAVFSVLVFLMIYLVPQLLSFIYNMGGSELPLHTRMLVATSHAFTDYWYWLLGVPLLVIALFFFVLRISRRARLWMDAFKLKIWVIGPIMEKVILARFASFFALMYASGITVLESLEVTSKIVGNLAIEKALQEVREQISEGQGISDSFARTELFPPLVVRMVSIGESTGELDAAMQNVSYFYNREVREGIERMQALIGPLLTVILGGTLAWTILSVLGPIYDILGNMPL